MIDRYFFHFSLMTLMIFLSPISVFSMQSSDINRNLFSCSTIKSNHYYFKSIDNNLAGKLSFVNKANNKIVKNLFITKSKILLPHSSQSIKPFDIELFLRNRRVGFIEKLEQQFTDELQQTTTKKLIINGAMITFQKFFLIF